MMPLPRRWPARDWSSAEGPMPPDFPAAHSMDTTWFAVDRDGHVACFSSGEAGAVPSRAAEPEGTGDVLSELARALPRGGVVYDRKGRFLPGGRPASFEH